MTNTTLPSILAVFEKDSTFWLPGARSKMAYDIAGTWNTLLYVSLFFFFVVVGAMLLFVIKYRRRSNADKVSTVTHNTPLEIVWTLIPLIVVMWFFVVGFKTFVSYDTPPSDALVINATGQQWSFTFSYPGGGTSDVLFVPKGRAVRLDMTSSDVLHALYIPNFHIGKNMIQGRTTYLWFEATQLSGDAGYPIYCTQYCGQSHSTMASRVVVLEPDEFERKLVELANPFKHGKEYVSYAEVGEKIYMANCTSCHTNDGKDNTGPTWKDFWTRTHEFSTSNEPGFVLNGSDPDEKKIKYIAESVTNPGAKIVKGRLNQMSSYTALFSDDASADPVKNPVDYVKYQRVLAVAEYMKKLAQGDEYDASKAPKFRDAEAEASSATSSQPATAPSPNGKQ